MPAESMPKANNSVYMENLTQSLNKELERYDGLVAQLERVVNNIEEIPSEPHSQEDKGGPMHNSGHLKTLLIQIEGMRGINDRLGKMINYLQKAF